MEDGDEGGDDMSVEGYPSIAPLFCSRLQKFVGPDVSEPDRSTKSRTTTEQR